MGRVFGVFLLIFGIGLAAYGLPSTEPEWSPAIEKLTRLPAKAGEADAADSPASTRAGRASGTEAGFKSKPVDRTTDPRAAGVAPMEKLRAAGQARIDADSEPTAIHRPTSTTGKLDSAAPVPTPVEIIRPAGVPARPPSVAAPPVVAAAKRESTLREKPQEMPISKHPVATQGVGSGSDRSARAVGGAASPPVVSGAATLRPVTLSLSPSLSPGARPGMHPSDGSVPPKDTTPLSGHNEKAATSDTSAAATGSATTESPKPRMDATARQALHQRYAPPAYLGKVPQAFATRDAPPRRGKSQDFWESRQQSGM